MNMRKKPGINFEQYFPRADKAALHLLLRMLAFDPSERPTAEEALQDAYFQGLAQPSREPTREAVSKLAFEFERRKLAVDEVRGLIYREILEYHPQVLADYLAGPRAQPSFYYPSAVDKFKRQFAELEARADGSGAGAKADGRGAAGGAGTAGNGLGQATSLPRERVREFQHEASKYNGKPAHGGGHASAVHDLGAGVRNMSVVEGGGASVPPPGVPNGAPPRGYHHPHVAAEMASQQLLRSNSYQ